MHTALLKDNVYLRVKAVLSSFCISDLFPYFLLRILYMIIDGQLVQFDHFLMVTLSSKKDSQRTKACKMRFQAFLSLKTTSIMPHRDFSGYPTWRIFKIKNYAAHCVCCHAINLLTLMSFWILRGCSWMGRNSIYAEHEVLQI